MEFREIDEKEQLSNSPSKMQALKDADRLIKVKVDLIKQLSQVDEGSDARQPIYKGLSENRRMIQQLGLSEFEVNAVQNGYATDENWALKNVDALFEEKFNLAKQLSQVNEDGDAKHLIYKRFNEINKMVQSSGLEESVIDEINDKYFQRKINDGTDVTKNADDGIDVLEAKTVEILSKKEDLKKIEELAKQLGINLSKTKEEMIDSVHDIEVNIETTEKRYNQREEDSWSESEKAEFDTEWKRQETQNTNSNKETTDQSIIDKQNKDDDNLYQESDGMQTEVVRNFREQPDPFNNRQKNSAKKFNAEEVFGKNKYKIESNDLFR